jgi:hypothetical protein
MRRQESDKKPGMQENGEEFVKVVVDLPEPDFGVSGEGMWAVSLGDDVYEIRNSPWHARNINWGDWVKAVAPSADKWPVFKSIVKRSGHRTIHVFLLEEGLGRKQEILAEVNKLGASYENSDGKMYAVDCPPEMDVIPLTKYFDELEAEEVLDYRTNEY